MKNLVASLSRRSLLIPSVFLAVLTLCLWTLPAIFFLVSAPSSHHYHYDSPSRFSQFLVNPVNDLTLSAKREPDYLQQSPTKDSTIVVNRNHSTDQAAKEEEDAENEVRTLMADFRETAGEAIRKDHEGCEGRKVFIYDLPHKFNANLLSQCHRMVPWFNMCPFLGNSGMGQVILEEDEENEVLVPPHRWFETHQYTLEILFHTRLREYECLTEDPAEATLFYIPYYGGLDVLRWHFQINASNVQRDALGLELVEWLDRQKWFQRRGGIDHVLVLGKISWDFRRYRDTDGWGSNLLELAQMQQITKLLIERHPWHPNDIGVPHPTFFHPQSDTDMRTWQAHMNTGRPRRHLVSFAGSPRPNQSESIRSLLIHSCRQHNDSCFLQSCEGDVCLRPRTTVKLFLESHFCLQPPGDSPTRRSLFDSLIAGCIPVLFDPYTAYFQYPWHLPANASLYSVYIPSSDVRHQRIDVVEKLRRIPISVRDEMRTRIIYEIMPGLVYSPPGRRTEGGEMSDAFDISLNSLFHRIQSRVQRWNSSSSS